MPKVDKICSGSHQP